MNRKLARFEVVRDHLLDGLGRRATIACVSRVIRRRGAVPELQLAPRLRFELDADEVAGSFEEAVARARVLAAQPATLGDRPLADLRLARAEASFDRADGWRGSLHFEAKLDAPFPLPFTAAALAPAPEGEVRLVDALAAAAAAMQSPIAMNRVTERGPYWIIPTVSIGCHGTWRMVGRQRRRPRRRRRRRSRGGFMRG